MEQKIRTVLKDLGVPQHIKGYRYLVVAVRKVIEDPEELSRVTKTLYPAIAKECGTTSSCVERAIRHAVECAFNGVAPDVIEKYFGNSIAYYRAQPTNGHFIAAVVEAVQQEAICQ